jgi:hypothetical protein
VHKQRVARTRADNPDRSLRIGPSCSSLSLALVEDDAIAVWILQLEHPAGWKFHDFHGDFHAGRAGRVKGGVEIRHLKSQGERRLAGHGVGERKRLARDVVFDPPLAGAQLNLHAGLEAEQALVELAGARNIGDDVEDEGEFFDLDVHEVKMRVDSSLRSE